MTSINPRAHRAICSPVQFVSGETGSLDALRMRLSTSREKLPVIVICRFQSVATPSRDGKLPGLVRRCFPVSATGPGFFSGTRDFAGFLNLFGPFQAARRSFRALLKFCQEPSRRFTNALHVLPCVVAHEQQHGEFNVGKIRIAFGEIQNVER